MRVMVRLGFAAGRNAANQFQSRESNSKPSQLSYSHDCRSEIPSLNRMESRGIGFAQLIWSKFQYAK
jgi:hypothetical protein